MVGKSQLPLGETWEVSRHRDGASFTTDKTPLNEVYNENELPFLVKFIDTSKNLSIQVHPDDSYAARNENDKGKSECWLILEANEGSGIYLGLKEGVSKSVLQSAVDEGREVNELLNFYPVKRGDFFYVPSGSIHAIGSDVTLIEVQQSSGVTYRVWDWNRLENGKPRELHVEKAMDVISFTSEKNQPEYFKIQNEVIGNSEKKLVENPDFILKTCTLNESEKRVLYSSDRCMAITVLKGNLKVDNVKLSSYESIIVSKNESVEINCESEKAEFIVVT